MKRFRLLLPSAVLSVLLVLAVLYFAFRSRPLNFYVSVTGLDLPGCGRTTGYPCATPQYVLDNLVPKTLDRMVKVNLGEGLYRGFEVSGFEADGPDAGLIIEGHRMETEEAHELEMQRRGFKLPAHCGPHDAGIVAVFCGDIFDRAKVNGCEVNGYGSQVTVECPDGGALQDVVFE